MAQTLTVRIATAEDVPAVDQLLRRSYPKLLKAHYPPSVLVTAVPKLSRAKPDLVCCGTYYVAESADGVILGAGGWTRSGHRPKTADIRHVATDPSAVRRGVGSALLKQVLEIAGLNGIRRFDCLSTRAAVPFYAAQGFETVGPLDIKLAEAIVFPAIRMVKMT